MKDATREWREEIEQMAKAKNIVGRLVGAVVLVAEIASEATELRRTYMARYNKI